MIKLKKLLAEINLCEGLMRSVPPEEFQQHVELWPIAKNKFTSKITNDKIQITLTDNLNEKEIKNLLTWINNLGWDVGLFLFNKLNPQWEKFDEKKFIEKYANNTIGIRFDIKAKYDKDNTYLEITNNYYHVTRTKVEQKILKIGLAPRSKGKMWSHPDRIYLAKRIMDAVALAETFSVMENDHQYTIFKVDIISAAKQNKELKLYNDPDMSGGLYTLSNIHPKFLKVVKRITV
jgi:hypothetical protein